MVQFLRIFYNIICLVFLCFEGFSMQAQPNTLVAGKIENAEVLREITLYVNQRYLTNETDIYSSRIIDDNSFAFAVEINEPQLVVLEYAKNQGTLYLEPNDTLYINCDAENFQYSFQFLGRSGHNNTLLSEYHKLNPRVASAFEMTQYKQKNYWYRNSPKMDAWMMSMDREKFTLHMQERKDKSRILIKNYDREHAQKLTDDFKEFLTADATYDWAYHMLLYGQIFKNMYQLEADFLDFVDTVSLYHPQIGNQWYREFLLAYFDYLNLKSNIAKSSFAYEYDLAANLLIGKPLAFYQSEILARAFRSKNQEAILDKYWEFVGTNEFGQFDEKVVATYMKAMKFAEGTSAPDFALNDKGNKIITLASLEGKTVYLNFWTTWCRPCINKMESVKLIQSELEKLDVVFINVSLDRDELTWKNTLTERSFKGIHVLASNGLNSEIAKAYEVKVLPQYFIINKKGKFVKAPKFKGLEELKKTLLDTAKE